MSSSSAKRAVIFTVLISALSATPLLASAQQAPPPPQAVQAAPGPEMVRPPRGMRAFQEALQAANVSPDQQARITQMMRDGKAKAKSEPDKQARRADAKQLRADIMNQLSPQQRDVFLAKMREFKQARRAMRQGNAPPPQQ
jgi:hypothetical protein